jgi:glucokinase
VTLTIGVDIGGTKIAAGVVDQSGTILSETKVETPAKDPDAIASAVSTAVERLRQEHEVIAVGIGAAGFVDAARSTILFAPNISWVDEPLAKTVSARCGLPVVVENDANAATWGEFRFGAGYDVDDLVLITVGTGVGGGIVIDGVLQRGSYGMAGEVGHLRMVPAGIRCGCGQYGCWEQYASGTALVRAARDRCEVEDPGSAHLMALVDGDPSALTGPMITEQATAGDPLSVELLHDAGRWLGEGIATLTAILDSSVVALGGGVSAAGDLLLKPAQEALRRSLTAVTHRPMPELRVATLGNTAGLVGAADLARTPARGDR